MTTPHGYDEVKALAKQMHRPIPSLLALARQNDPFFVGSPNDIRMAEWFADAWRRFGYTDGVHIRRVHYRLVVEGTATKHDGTPYENTETCWADLNTASRYARYLGLVDPLAFVDRRNPEPQLFASGPATMDEPTVEIEAPYFSLPTINADVASELYLSMPTPEVTGYAYFPTNQPYHLELWIEKTTMDDVLIPVCQRYGINLQTGAGFQSVTNVLKMLLRIAEAGKPTRVFYISDFDPAGDGMPVQVARQVEFWLDTYAPEIDIKLTPLALTLDQVRRYHLPRVPVKDTDLRKANFEEQYGEGAVELDALQALHPGALAQLIKDAAAPYRDATLARRLLETGHEAEQLARDAWADATADQQDELTAVEEEGFDIADRYRDRLAALRDEMATDMAPLEARLEVVRLAIQKLTDEFEVGLPDRPEPEVTPSNESGSGSSTVGATTDAASGLPGATVERLRHPGRGRLTRLAAALAALTDEAREGRKG